MNFLQIIMGPMFSGKSTEFIRIIREYKFIEKKILVVKHSLDNNRYNQKICTHDKQIEECISITNIDDLNKLKEYKEAEIIFIEEAQFFKNLYNFISIGLYKHKKSFIIAGLDGDFKMEPFGDILKLIPLANKVTKLNALCKFCKNGTEAPFTKRLVRNNEQQLVGGEDAYAAVCRHHYYT